MTTPLHQERFFAVGSRVQRREYRVRETWAPWMTGMATPEQAPFAILIGMRDVQDCATDEEAIAEAARLNADAGEFGTLQRFTVVVP
jgi:hypothetical protein